MSASTILPVIHPVEGDLHVDTLTRLHAAIGDAMRDIDRLKRHTSASTAPIRDAFRELHERHRRELAAVMAGHEHPPEEATTLHGLVQSGVDKLREIFVAPEDPVLESLLDNGRDVLDAYNAALTEGGPADTIELLRRQREELGELVVKHDSRLSR